MGKSPSDHSCQHELKRLWRDTTGDFNIEKHWPDFKKSIRMGYGRSREPEPCSKTQQCCTVLIETRAVSTCRPGSRRQTLQSNNPFACAGAVKLSSFKHEQTHLHCSFCPSLNTLTVYVRELIHRSCTLLLCTRETHTSFTAAVSYVRHNLTYSLVITLRNMQNFRRGAEDDAQVLPSLTVSPPTKRPFLMSGNTPFWKVNSKCTNKTVNRNSAQCHIKVVRTCLRQWSCLFVLWGTVLHHKIQSSFSYLQNGYLGSRSIALWVQTPVKCLHSKSFSSLICRPPLGFQRVPAPDNMASTAISQQEWAETSSRRSTCTIIRFGSWVFKPFGPNQFSARQNEEATRVFCFSWLWPWDFPSLNQWHWSCPWHILDQCKESYKSNHKQDFSQPFWNPQNI